MQRITAEQVIEAYKKTGAIPMRRAWYATSGVRCRACALTAMAMAKEPKFIEQHYVENSFVSSLSLTKPIRETLGISFEYLDGFTDGFDQLDKQEDHYDPVYYEGYKDGEAVGEAVDKQILYPGVEINAENHS